MLKILKRKNKKNNNIKLNKYKYKIIYKNHNITEGILETENLDKVYETFMLNNFTQMSNNTKAFYYNKNEIQEITVEKVEEDEQC